MEITS